MVGIEIESNANVHEVSKSACLVSTVVVENTSVSNESSNENKDEKDSVLIENDFDETRNVSYSTAVSEQSDDGQPNGLISAILKNLAVTDLTESPILSIKGKAKLNTTYLVPSKIVPFHFGKTNSVAGHAKEFGFKMQSASTPMPVLNKVIKGEFS